MPESIPRIRLERLEHRMSTLEALPEAVSQLQAQVLQLGHEMRAGFSAIRDEVRAGDEETRRVLREEMRAGDEETRQVLREEIRAGHLESRNFMRALYEDVLVRMDAQERRLLEAIRGGDEENRRHMLVLHEHVLEVIRTIGEGGSSSRR